jgi:hypothetical protein
MFSVSRFNCISKSRYHANRPDSLWSFTIGKECISKNNPNEKRKYLRASPIGDRCIQSRKIIKVVSEEGIYAKYSVKAEGIRVKKKILPLLKT